MEFTNTLNLPAALVRAVTLETYERGGADRTITELIGPPRQVTLLRRHAHELSEDVSDRIWSLLGQASHEILRRAAVDAIVEKRLSIIVNGWTVSGQFDHLSLIDHTLTDWKVSSSWSVRDGGKEEWQAQVNSYAHLLRSHGYRVQRGQVIAILRDWRKNEALRYGRDGYPPRQVAVIGIPLWTPEECAAYLRRRVELHQAAERTLPHCTNEERWLRNEKWALMYPKRKSAVRLYDSATAAETALATDTTAGATIVHRPGEAIRCSRYCAALPVCRGLADGQHQPGEIPDGGNDAEPF